MRLVTIDQARAQVYSAPHDDDQLALYVSAAEDAAEAFLNRKVYPDSDSLEDAVQDGSAGEEPLVVNAAIRVAVLLLAGHLYRNREEVVTGTITAQLPMGAHSLLWPYRKGLGI